MTALYFFRSSSGYGLVLVSEGLDGTRHAAERVCSTAEVLPEDIGRETATALLQDIVMVMMIAWSSCSVLVIWSFIYWLGWLYRFTVSEYSIVVYGYGSLWCIKDYTWNIVWLYVSRDCLHVHLLKFECF